MPKFLITASCSAEGLQGLQKASGRMRAATAAKVECLYFALGEDDIYGIVELPDRITAAAMGIAASATELIRTRLH